MAPFYFFYKARTSLTMCSLSFALMMTLGFYTSRLFERVDALQKRLSSLKHLAVQSEEAAVLIQAHRKDFSAFESCGFERPLTPEALQASVHYPVKFGAISSVKGVAKNNKFVSQDVCVSISCLRDRDIFALLDQLINQGPGIFQIYDVIIIRTSPLTEELLKKIGAGKVQALFDGKITATWIHQ
jgi:hypothetical protein